MQKPELQIPEIEEIEDELNVSHMIKNEPLDFKRIYGDIYQRLKAERDEVKSFVPIINGGK